MPLPPNDRVVFQTADAASVQQALSNLGSNLAAGSWLGPSNRYGQSVVQQLRADLAASSLNDSDFGQYMAASVPLHCGDGWALLGRASECHARGDRDGARHLAYYAELRAAIGLLAAQAIGIFNTQHVVIDSSNKVVRFANGPGTHQVTWLALESWADSSPSADLLLDVVTPGGKLLRDWLDAFGPVKTGQLVGSQWLKAWGVDLQRLGLDRDARNEASYRPTHLNTRPILNAQKAAAFLGELWTIHEPGADSRFEYLDRHLLRLALEAVQAATTLPQWRSRPTHAAAFRASVENTVAIVRPLGLPEGEWISFLTREREPTDAALLQKARGTAQVGDAAHHEEVMSRGALLLRVATGACSRLLAGAGLGRTELEFWWKALGEERGLWEPGDEPAEFVDLWADIATALEDVQSWLDDCQNSAASGSYASWLNLQAHGVTVLGGCERIMLWGLSL